MPVSFGLVKIISGNSHPALAIKISDYLGIEPARVLSSKLLNGELVVTMGESVRENDIFIVQTNHNSFGTLNESLFELLHIIHACKLGSAGRITAGMWPNCFIIQV